MHLQARIIDGCLTGCISDSWAGEMDSHYSANVSFYYWTLLFQLIFAFPIIRYSLIIPEAAVASSPLLLAQAISHHFCLAASPTKDATWQEWGKGSSTPEDKITKNYKLKVGEGVLIYVQPQCRNVLHKRVLFLEYRSSLYKNKYFKCSNSVRSMLSIKHKIDLTCICRSVSIKHYSNLTSCLALIHALFFFGGTEVELPALEAGP